MGFAYRTIGCACYFFSRDSNDVGPLMGDSLVVVKIYPRGRVISDEVSWHISSHGCQLGNRRSPHETPGSE
jgi:hypothetical protein